MSIITLPNSTWPTRLDTLRQRYVDGDIELDAFETEVTALLNAGVEDEVDRDILAGLTAAGVLSPNETRSLRADLEQVYSRPTNEARLLVLP